MKHTIFFSLLLILCAGIGYAQETDSGKADVDKPATPFTEEAVPTATVPVTGIPATTEVDTKSGESTTSLPDASVDLATGDKEAEEAEELERLKKEQQDEEAEAKKNQVSEIDIWELLVSGGLLMIPIAALSVLGLAFALERFVMLRRNAIMPRRLFNQIAPYLQPDVFNPQAVWNICVHNPSPAARIIQAMLLKVGRPLPEIEATVNVAKQEEATNLYSNVRWITLVASLAPLLGLLGTVVGMIEAFFTTAHLEIGGNRAEELSSGIYMALVTTAAGLVVAIPAAFIAHWYEGRILKAFNVLDSRLLPIYDVLEQQEGKNRITLAQYQAKQ